MPVLLNAVVYGEQYCSDCYRQQAPGVEMQVEIGNTLRQVSNEVYAWVGPSVQGVLCPQCAAKRYQRSRHADGQDCADPMDQRARPDGRPVQL